MMSVMSSHCMGATVQGRCTSLVKVMEDYFQMFDACFGKRHKVLEHALAATKEGKDLMSEALSLVTGRAEHGKWSHVGKEEPT